MLKKESIIVDCGARWCRAGFEGDSEVRLRIPTLVGKGKSKDASVSETTFVGAKALLRGDLLNANSPIANGTVVDWDSMERIWAHVFAELKVEDISEHPVLLTETVLNTNKNRERMGEIMLEKFNAAAVFIESQPLLAAYAAGRLTCLVAHCGHEFVQTAVISEGYVLKHAGSLLEVGGRHVTDHLVHLLATSEGENGVTDEALLEKYGGIHALEELKEKVCYLAVEDYEQEVAKAKGSDALRKRYKLPDGQTVEVNEERFLAPEIMFRPYLFGDDDRDSGIQSNISHSISQSNIDIRKELYSNIVLSGGNSMFDGLQDRLTSEMKNSLPGTAKVKVTAKIDRNDFVFLGGSILSSLGPAFQKMYITKEQLAESGNHIFNRSE